MPRPNDETIIHKIGKSGFSFKGARIERLGATEYTLVTIAVDETGSVDGFQNDLRKMLETAVEACKKSPRSDNLLLRVVYFSTKYPNGVNEVHGFKLLSEINPADYPEIRPGGCTPLNDAAFSSLGAMNVYGKQLSDDEFGVNGIMFIITDGGDNDSVATMKMVKEEVRKAVSGEILESIISVLVGINADEYAGLLARFKDEAGMTHFINAGEATKGKLAKLAEFVSSSISSQSQALGTGGPSQNISPTI
ncbi:MAG: VWA domain-containing protein [Candidatus Niyogibacteria bacterium]|nr:MAG: VWA domain-containing protein [Candidatus Niyogibacteria bacterium]